MWLSKNSKAMHGKYDVHVTELPVTTDGNSGV